MSCQHYAWRLRPAKGEFICRICKRVLSFEYIDPAHLNNMAKAIEYEYGYYKAEKWRGKATMALVKWATKHDMEYCN